MTGIRYGNCFLSTSAAISVIKREKPDIVHLQCLNEHFVNVYRLVAWLRKHGVKTVLTLHAEFMYTANCGHAFDCSGWKNGCGNCPRLYEATKSLFFDRTHASFERMKRAFSGFDKDLRVVSVSPWLDGRRSASPILGGMPGAVILNGVDTGVFRFREHEELAKKHGAEGKKIVLHVTAMFRNRSGDPKGGQYVVRLAEMMKDDPVLFLVAGKHEKCEGLPGNILLLGNIGDQELLARYYSMADVTLLTSRRETYSMVCAESLCCGTPIVGFKAGGPEQISLPQFSRFVDYGDMDGLRDAVSEQIGIKFGKIDIAKDAAAVYSAEYMIESYIQAYREMLCKD